MNRRKFITLIGCAASWPTRSYAQRATKVYRVALVYATPPVSDMSGPTPANPYVRAFLDGLRELGYIEGSNLTLVRFSAEGNYARFADITAEVVRGNFDVVVAANNGAIELLKRATSNVPIVMAPVTNPVEAGFVASLARPGGNITGFTRDTGPVIDGKRLQLLTEAVPTAKRISYLGTKYEWEVQGQPLRDAAQKLGVALSHIELVPFRYADSLPLIAQSGVQAIITSRDGSHMVSRDQIVDFTLRHRLPAMFCWREIAEVGGLMTYAADYSDIMRKAAGYVDRILKGAKSADLPVQQPSKFELVINLKTANKLGITIPPRLLAAADATID